MARGVFQCVAVVILCYHMTPVQWLAHFTLWFERFNDLPCVMVLLPMNLALCIDRMDDPYAQWLGGWGFLVPLMDRQFAPLCGCTLGLGLNMNLERVLGSTYMRCILVNPRQQA
jgi:hypothetical protein